MFIIYVINNMRILEIYNSILKLNQNICLNNKLLKLIYSIENNKSDIIKAVLFSHIDNLIKVNDTSILIAFNQKVDIDIFIQLLLNIQLQNDIMLQILYFDKYRLYGFLQYNNYNDKLDNLYNIIQTTEPENISNILLSFIKHFYTNYLYDILNNYSKVYLKILNNNESTSFDEICSSINTNFDSIIDSIINNLSASLELYSKEKDFII